MKRKRGRNAQGEKKRWSAARKEKELSFNLGKSVTSELPKKKRKSRPDDSGSRHQAGGAPPPLKKRKWKKHKKKEPKEKEVDACGDTVVEHDFGDSDDSEEDAIRQAKAEKNEKERQAAAKGRRQVLVTGIPWKVDPNVFNAFFQTQCGEEIVDAAYPKDETGRSKGIVFFTFKSEDAVAKALALDEKSYEARQLSVKVVTDKRERDNKKSGKGNDSDDESDPSGFDSEFDDGSPSESDEEHGKSQRKGKGSGKSKGKRKSGKSKGKR